MRRLLAVVLIAFLGLPLVASAQSALYSKPNVVVYPFIANASSIDREASSRLATILATQMANSGKVGVIPPPPGTERKDYLSVARSNNADYYVSGYISPLGNGVSVVEQVVSAASGIVVFSQTAQLQTYNDAAGQGDDLALFISRHANRGLAAIGTPPPQASPTPASSSGPSTNLGKLFSRRKKPAATPKPATTGAPRPAATSQAAALTNVTPQPASVPRVLPPVAAAPTKAPVTAPTRTPATQPTKTPVTVSTPPTPAATPKAVAAANAAAETYAVLPVEGTADAALREFATQRLLARTNGERATAAVAACAGHAVRAVLTGALAVRPDAQFGGGSASFELTASDCSGKILWQQTRSNDAGGAQGQQLATERAVDAAIGAYLNPPKRRR